MPAGSAEEGLAEWGREAFLSLCSEAKAKGWGCCYGHKIGTRVGWLCGEGLASGCDSARKAGGGACAFGSDAPGRTEPWECGRWRAGLGVRGKDSRQDLREIGGGRGIESIGVRMRHAFGRTGMWP